MKRVSILSVFVLITSMSFMGMSIEARENGYSGPEPGKTGSGAGGMSTSFKAELSAAKMKPAATAATGEATFELTGMGGAGPGGYSGPESGKMGTGAGGGMSGTLNYKVSVKDIENVTAAHLHAGRKAATEGPVIAPLFSGPRKAGVFSGMLAEGTITDKDLRGPLSGKTVQDLAKMINSGDVYVNVHTEKFPEGEIRGHVKQAMK